MRRTCGRLIVPGIRPVSMTDLDGEKPAEPRASGGMLSGVSALSQTGISGPAMSGYLDLRPDPGIPGYAWLGIALGIVVVAILLWSWFFGH